MTDNEPTQSPPRGAAGAQERFVRLARERVMPLLKQAADALAARGCGATARLHEVDGRLVAQLEAMPPGLPAGEAPAAAEDRGGAAREKAEHGRGPGPPSPYRIHRDLPQCRTGWRVWCRG